MEQDQQLKALLRRLDQTIEQLPPPVVDLNVGQDIHRFRSPFVKFLEWVINGGAGMALLFGLVSVSSIFWDGINFGWVALPLVLLLMRPFLGDTPVQRPWRMVMVLAAGAIFSRVLATSVDFYVYYNANPINLTFFSFFVENSLGTMFHPEYALMIAAIVTLVVVGSQWTARRYPWLERKAPTKPWRSVLSSVILLVTLALFTSLIFRSDRIQYYQSLQGALNDPRMSRFARGDNVAETGSAVAPELAAAGVPVGREARIQFLQTANAESQKSLANILLKGFQEREHLLTRADLLFSAHLLKSVAESEEPHPDLIFTELWWKAHCFAEDYGIGGESRSFDRYLTLEVALPSLLAPSLSLEDAERWYDTMSSRPIRTWTQIQDVEKLMATHILMVAPQIQDESYTSYRKLLARVKARYILMLLTHEKGGRISLSDDVFATQYLRSIPTDARQEISNRVRDNEERSLLLGVLEARLAKMETGRYPETLKAKIRHYDYESSALGPIFRRESWNGEEGIIACRLPR